MVFLNEVHSSLVDGALSGGRVDVLVSPLRRALRLRDLTSAERVDLFDVARNVQAAIEKEFKTDSSTVNIQVQYAGNVKFRTRPLYSHYTDMLSEDNLTNNNDCV